MTRTLSVLVLLYEHIGQQRLYNVYMDMSERCFCAWRLCRNWPTIVKGVFGNICMVNVDKTGQSKIFINLFGPLKLK